MTFKYTIKETEEGLREEIEGVDDLDRESLNHIISTLSYFKFNLLIILNKKYPYKRE